MLKRIIAIIILGAGIIGAQAGTWQSAGTMQYPIANGQVVFNQSQSNPRFYFFGGYLKGLQKSTDWIQEYNLTNKSWKIVPFLMNTARIAFNAQLWDSTIIYFGGADSESDDRDAIESWNFIKATAPVIKGRDANFQRSFVNGAVYNNELFVLGGNYSTITDTINSVFGYALDTDKKIYEDNNALMANTSDNMSFLADDVVYLFGGVYGGFLKKFINTFTISDGSVVTRGETINKPRAGGAAVYNPETRRGYLIGGYNETDKALSTVEEVIINWDGTLTINTIASLRYARKYPMAAIYNNTIYVFGGFDQNDNVVEQVEIYDGIVTDIKEEGMPSGFALGQNYPNPFNPTTIISFRLPAEGFAIMKLYNSIGEEVVTLVNGYMHSGEHAINFDARGLSSGVYFYRLTAGGYTAVKKMVVEK